MADELSFHELRAARAELGQAVAPHRERLLWFQHPEKPWFIVDERRRSEERADASPPEVRHLSSTATCFESLLDPLASSTLENVAADGAKLAEFAKQALSRPDDETWSSELAAGIYCRVRTLTPILSLASPTVIGTYKRQVVQLARRVWDQVEHGEEDHQGVSEEAPQSGPVRQRYPANAFHTYWAIKMLEDWQSRQFSRVGKVPVELIRKRRTAELWARHMLAKQTALIQFDADRVDAHQLAWALSTGFLGTEQTPVTASTPHLELYQAALAAYFASQLPSGGWPLYEPLFHYPAAGNAYCYTFETLAVLLRPALHREGGQVFA